MATQRAVEYSPKRVRVLPSRAAEQAAGGNQCWWLTRTVQALYRLSYSQPSRARGRGHPKAPPPRRRAGPQRSQAGWTSETPPGLPAAANQRPARRGHFLVGRQGGLRSSLVRVSRIGCARVPSGRGQRRLGAQFPSACGAPAAEPGRSTKRHVQATSQTGQTR